MRTFLSILMTLALNGVLYCQTFVSGGIFSNTTWTKANSPYVVTDTVVVFPNVTLTIQPGVIVKFNANKRLEIRQAKLLATGTVSDSITFTSNLASPTKGSWANVLLNGGSMRSDFNYCNFKYGNWTLMGTVSDTLCVRNSRFDDNANVALIASACKLDSCFFRNNDVGAYACNGVIHASRFHKNTFVGIQVNNYSGGTPWVILYILNCHVDSSQMGITNLFQTVIDSCSIINNQYGITDAPNPQLTHGYSIIKNSTISFNSKIGVNLPSYDSLISCEIKNNLIGVSDSVGWGHSTGGNRILKNVIESNYIGIKLWDPTELIRCNRICNNTLYGFYYNVNFSSNIDISQNDWCTPDSISTVPLIYDAYDNINKGIAYFMPMDTICPYPITSINKVPQLEISIFPNPFYHEASLKIIPHLSNAVITVKNCLGYTVKEIKNVNGSAIFLKRDDLPSGIYILSISQHRNVYTRKLLIIDN